MKYLSLSFNSDQSNASTYLAVTGIVLSSAALSIPNAHAARFAISEVVVYEGEPIDYSNRDDVIFIDDTSMYDDFSTTVSVPEKTNKYSSKSKAVAKQTTPVNQTNPQRPTNKQQKQFNAIAQEAKKRIAPIAQVKLSKPFDNSVSNTKISRSDVEKTKTVSNSEKAELAVFYAYAKKFEKSVYPKKSSAAKLKPIGNVPVKTIAQKKAKGKDPELVAFYMDVFAKQNNHLSNQSRTVTTKTIKQISTKAIAKKNATKKKQNEVQLSLKTTKAKDPELVAFYNQVFSQGTQSPSKYISKQNPVVVSSKGKDPELVAFYEREFGKGTSIPIMPKLKNHISNKVDLAAKTKSKKKNIAKKIAKKVKVKTKSTINTEIAAIEKLIGELQAQKMI